MDTNKNTNENRLYLTDCGLLPDRELTNDIHGFHNRLAEWYFTNSIDFWGWQTCPFSHKESLLQPSQPFLPF